MNNPPTEGHWGLSSAPDHSQRRRAHTEGRVRTVKIVLHPRFGKSWVHYDRTLVDAKNGEEISFYRSGFGCGSFDRAEFPSWRCDVAISYITSPDKKQWRRINDYWDKDVSLSKFEHDCFLFNFNGQIKESIKIIDVVVENPPYLCPMSGCVWLPREKQENLFSKRLWIIKLRPKCPVNMVGPDFIDLLLSRHKTKSAFLSGELLRQIDRWAEDPRKFLWEKDGVYKADVIRSAARKFKKLHKKITPIPKQTIMFFKALGVLKHIRSEKNENTKQKSIS